MSYQNAPTKPIVKANNVTSSERYLTSLCNRTFLSLWNYPSIFRDQGIGQTNIGKEVCDLMVVFGNHVLIFSDKHCEFPQSNDLNKDWSRWFRRAIYESAKQIWGAERWIKSHPDRLFLDSNCTTPLPLNIPDVTQVKFHRIIVAHGAAGRCKRELDGSGSLIIDTNIIGKDHFDSQQIKPFRVGQIDPAKGYIHVFDDTTLEIMLSTLDTITDLVSYLSKKEVFLSGKMDVFAAGEEELLALYLKDINEKKEHDFVVQPNINAVVIDEGLWEEFTRSPQRIAQIEKDRISYVWDDLIEVFNKHLLEGTRYTYSHPDVNDVEKAHRFLARESRVRRRMLGRALIELIERTPVTFRGTRLFLPSNEDDPLYVFLVVPQLRSVSYSEYREVRAKLLNACIFVAKLQFPEARDIVGIATETGLGFTRSEDLLYFDAREWTDELHQEALSLKHDLGLLQNLKMFRSVEYEYPITTQEEFDNALGSNPRNKPCPCGSGKK